MTGTTTHIEDRRFIGRKPWVFWIEFGPSNQDGVRQARIISYHTSEQAARAAQRRWRSQ